MRWLVVVLALLVAIPASGKTLIVRCDVTSGSSPNDYANQASDLFGLMKQRGGTYSDIPITATKSEWLRTGLQVWKGWNLAGVSSEQFDVVVVLGFARSLTFPTGCTPCSLGMAGVSATHGGWPTVPIVFIGEPKIGGSKWTATSTCSTGVASNAGAYTSVKRTYVAYPNGSTNVWKAMSVNLWPVVASTISSGITLRKVVSMNYSSTTPGGTPQASSILRTDADSTSFTGDSLIMWALYKTGSTIPVIFVETGGGVAQDVGLMGMAMQMADSASGGRVWDAAGAMPIKMGFGVTACTSRGKYTNDLSANASSHLGGGAFCYADSCDTTNVLAGLDSLGTLAGLKTTFYVDPDSLPSYPSVKSWFSRAGSYRVGLQPISGTITGATRSAGEGYPFASADVFGRLRKRVAAFSAGCSNVADSASVYCLVKSSFDVIKEYFPGLADRSVLPAFGDWSPVAVTRSGGTPGRDSMAYALWKAGIRTVVIRPEFINANTNVSGVVPSAGNVTYYPSGGVAPSTDPYGYGPEPESVPVYADPATPGRVVGKLNIVAERGQRQGPNVSYTDPSHDTRAEWFEGLVQDRWYFNPLRYYYHSFWTRTQVLTVSLGSLGGHGVSPGAIGVGPARIGWWQIKHTANQVNAANNLGWVDTVSGRQRHMFDWAFIEDLEP